MMSLFVTVDAPKTRETLVNFFLWNINHTTLLKRYKYSTQINFKFIRTCIIQTYRTYALYMNLGLPSNSEWIYAFQTIKIDFSDTRTTTIYHITDIVLACKEAQLHSISTIHLMTVWSKGWGEEAHGSLTWHIERPSFLLSTYKLPLTPSHSHIQQGRRALLSIFFHCSTNVWRVVQRERKGEGNYH